MISSSQFEPSCKMEKPAYWMWANRKHNMDSTHFTLPKSYKDSWEEQAFAEDAAGHLGGCIWPPRSYSCSFCKREFRSAQALGGHMNVHRRDRARLKQSSSSIHPQNEIHNNSNNPSGSLGFHQYPSHHKLCSFVYNPSPNSDPVVVASPSRVSLLTPHNQKNCPENTFIIPSFSSPIVQEQKHKRSHISSPKSRIVESACTVKADYVKTDLCVNLNLGVRRTRPAFSDYDHKDQEANGCKRRRTEASSIHLQSEEHKVHNNPSSIEDLDLELRLGDPPKVK